MDENPFENEKISIKNLLFTKAVPNYKLPISTDGRPIFSCTDCGDKFLIKSSYEYHIQRKSLKITYACKYCHGEKIFFNRCNLLSHIRSHVFKTATINVSDLKIEPLPLSYFSCSNQTNIEVQVPLDVEVPLQVPNQSSQDESSIQYQDQPTGTVICFECKRNIFSSGILYKDRAKHYTEFSNILYSCPICLLTLPTQCALKAHIRFHLKEPPYYCPECGIHLGMYSMVYPYTHDCESFRMMRVTAMLSCLVKNCNKVFHPNESYNHLRNNHVKNVYKCSACSVACYQVDNMENHLKCHTGKVKISDFFQCELCPGRLVIPTQIERHLKSHESQNQNDVYPCWTCGVTFKVARNLIKHQINKHQDVELKKICSNLSQDSIGTKLHLNPSSLLHMSKKCQKCSKYAIIRRPSNPLYVFSIPNQHICICTPQIICHLCKMSVDQDWGIIKKHYAKYHKEYNCLDLKLVLKKINMHQFKKGPKTKVKRKKDNRREIAHRKVRKEYFTPEKKNLETKILKNNFICCKCGEEFENKQFLEKHMVTHKDPFMAYQCMECGESFIAKRSFSTHLLLKHAISDVNIYIDQKKCYNEESLNSDLTKPNNFEENEPVKENQCCICREQFCNSIDLEKHFRVHGMAFLMKNNSKSTSPVKS